MATVELTDKNFAETIENNEIVIIDFWAPWCGPCKMFGPIYEKVSGLFTDVVFGKVNTDVEQGLAHHFQIRSIPTIMIMRDRYILFEQPGMIGEQDLMEVIKKVKSLDMEEIKAQAAADSQGSN